MLKAEDIEIQIMRMHGGDGMAIVHRPTGIRRSKGPPMLKPSAMQRELLQEIENELRERGLAQYLVNPRQTAKRRRPA